VPQKSLEKQRRTGGVSQLLTTYIEGRNSVPVLVKGKKFCTDDLQVTLLHNFQVWWWYRQSYLEISGSGIIYLLTVALSHQEPFFLGGACVLLFVAPSPRLILVIIAKRPTQSIPLVYRPAAIASKRADVHHRNF
jgi:hypothetical protein